MSLDVAAGGASPGGVAGVPHPAEEMRIILSFDVEEHHRIEAAVGLSVDADLKSHYSERVDESTRWLLDELARHDVKATFFVVGELARDNPGLIRAIHRAGHELASHSWDHRRLCHHTPASFREDLARSKGVLEEITSEAVVGYRAPTFSVGLGQPWAIDVLTESGIRYDSSIYPVRHDRYGIARAPRGPFLARGLHHTLLEIPPATLRLAGMNLPVGGGGYFRLLPLYLLKWGLKQVRRHLRPPVAMLYFHPWEFDLEQARLPLARLHRVRTYVGLSKTRARLTKLLAYPREKETFARAADVAGGLVVRGIPLSEFDLRKNALVSREVPGEPGGRTGVSSS
jgi:polysaccharide deacetylase family protein (PEP-CTERM system associated)